jgi:hypothetical protein
MEADVSARSSRVMRAQHLPDNAGCTDPVLRAIRLDDPRKRIITWTDLGCKGNKVRSAGLCLRRAPTRARR